METSLINGRHQVKKLGRITQEDDNCYCAICCLGQCTRSSRKLNLSEFTYEETQMISFKISNFAQNAVE